jgi:hypothetical protein
MGGCCLSGCDQHGWQRSLDVLAILSASCYNLHLENAVSIETDSGESEALVYLKKNRLENVILKCNYPN